MSDGDPLDIDDAIARLNRGSTSGDAIASVLAEVERLRAIEAQVSQLCTEHARAGMPSVRIDSIRAILGEGI